MAITQTNYITPRLGHRSATILGLILVAAITLVAQYLITRWQQTVVTESMALSQFAHVMWLRGMVYGLTAGGCWLASAVDARYLRWAIRGGLVVLMAIVQSQFADGWLRHLANLGGLACGQCLLFTWMRVPNWAPLGGGKTGWNEDSKRIQFGIGDVVIATTCVALLLAIVIRYSPPIEPLRYWSVLFFFFWLVAPLIAAFLGLALLSRRDLGRAVNFFAVSAALIVLSVAGLSGFQLVESGIELNANNASLARQITSFYGRMILGYALVFAIFAIAGRTEGDRETRTELDI